MRTVEKRLLDFNLKALYARLGHDPTPGIFIHNNINNDCLFLVEKTALQNAISRVTGSNVGDLRL